MPTGQPPADPSIGAMIESLLEQLPPGQRRLARLGAVPRRYDPLLLEQLQPIETGLARAAAEKLAGLRLLRILRTGEIQYQPVVRQHLLEVWREPEKRDEFMKWNRKAGEYYARLAELAQPGAQPGLQREALYHLIVVDEVDGMHRLGELFEDAYDRYQPGLAEDFVQVAVELSGQLTRAGLEWLEFFTIRLDSLYARAAPHTVDLLGDGETIQPPSEKPEPEARYQALVKTASVSTVQALARWELAKIHLDRSEWSEAHRLCDQSLAQLRSSQNPAYHARLLLTLGDIYLHLARSSGGMLTQERRYASRLARTLNHLVYLPSRVYEDILHRAAWLPALLLPGEGYQDWIIAHLLVRARDEFRAAWKLLASRPDDPALLAVQFALAEVEFEKGRWFRSGHYYLALSAHPAVAASPYRQARIGLGQACILTGFGQPATALSLLTAAAGVFERVKDLASLAETHIQAGLAHTRLGRPEPAAREYLEAFEILAGGKDGITRTQVAWRLEDLLHDGVSLETASQIRAALDGMPARCYIARFPASLLTIFRRLALVLALPITYLFTLVLGMAFIFSLTVPESLVALELTRANLGVLTLGDMLTLALGALLPVPLAIWGYQFIYGVVGTVATHLLGRRLVRLEKEQPDLLETSPSGLAIRSAGSQDVRRLAWDQVLTWTEAGYKLWRQPIHLLTRLLLVSSQPPAQTWSLDAITNGYTRLREDLRSRLGPARPRERHDLVFLGHFTTLLTGLLSALHAAGVVFVSHSLNLEATLKTGETVILWFSSLAVVFLGDILLALPAIWLWRALAHRARLRRFAGYRAQSVPAWLITAGAVLYSLAATLWMAGLLLLAP